MVSGSLRIIAGFLLILVGLIGWLLPIMPGWPFILLGLALLSRHFHWARRLRRQAQVYWGSRSRKKRARGTIRQPGA